MTGASGSSRGDRGQTTIDFLIGIAVFISTLAFVVGFVPSIVTPYTDHAARPVVADRAADELVHGALASDEPGVLNASCTSAFFGTGSDTGCSFTTSEPLTDRAGIDSRYGLNVTIETRDKAGDRAVACVSDTTGAVQSCTSGGTRLAADTGPQPENGAVVTAVRSERLDGTDVVVVVRVW